jgi:hypothetical protein
LLGDVLLPGEQPSPFVVKQAALPDQRFSPAFEIKNRVGRSPFTSFELGLSNFDGVGDLPPSLFATLKFRVPIVEFLRPPFRLA